MVRHSGFLTSFAVVLLAAFSVSVLERRSDGSPQIQRDSQDRTVLMAPVADRSRRETSPAVSDLNPLVMGPPGATIRFPVSANTLIIVGSLDVSGAAHSLLISSQADERRIVGGSQCSQGAVDLEYIDTASLSDLRLSFPEPNTFQPPPAASEDSKRSDHMISVHSLANEPTRRFLVPHFEFDQVVQQPCEALPLVEGSRVKVYMDPRIAIGHSDQQHQHLFEEAKRVCTTIESELLPLIEHWVGRITDLDGDQRLSVVLTDLERRKSSSDTPILGCVRRGDFSAEDQNSLAGDIVYLDQHLPPREQLRALLAHELTHAAIFCIRHEATHDSPLKNHSVPSWLNEAAAHWVERQFCSTPAGYAAREAAFRQSPAQCPIMMKDDDQYLAARRTGSRVAGLTFLQQHLRDASDLRALLEQCAPFEQSISEIADAPFSQLFRRWTMSQAWPDHDAFLPGSSVINCCSLTTADSGAVRRRLHGTAFLILQSNSEQAITIEATGDAQLQITVLHQENSLSTQHSHDTTAAACLRSADLKSLPRHEIQ